MAYPGHLIRSGETDPELVGALATGLALRGYKVTSPPGIFDEAFAAIVRTFQSQHIDAAGRPLVVDGQVGPLTWGALFEPRPAAQAATGLGQRAGLAAMIDMPVGEDDLFDRHAVMRDRRLELGQIAPRIDQRAPHGLRAPEQRAVLLQRRDGHDGGPERRVRHDG